ncbi:MAG: glycosyltransferase family 4 protein [Arachnia sp.]
MAGNARSILITNPGADLYGSDRMTLESVRALISGGMHVTVTVPALGPLTEALGEAGADVVVQRTPILRKSSLSPAGFLRLTRDTLGSGIPSLRLLRRVAPGTILVNTITSPLWFVLGRVTGTKIACHLHEAEGAVAAPVRWAMYAPLQLCHRVIANSSYTKKVLSESSFRLVGRVTVVHNSVPGPKLSTPPRAVLSDGIRLLYIGRLSRRKGLDSAVSALGLLRDRGVSARLDIVGAVFPGNEAYEEELRSRVSHLGLSEAVTFHGFQQQVWSFLSDCDIVLIPSVEDESFGNTAVEASLAARPLVVSELAGLIEATVVSEAAELVAPGDPEALSQAVEKIAIDWENSAMKAVADSRRVAERFSATAYRKALMTALGLEDHSSSGRL